MERDNLAYGFEVFVEGETKEYSGSDTRFDVLVKVDGYEVHRVSVTKEEVNNTIYALKDVYRIGVAYGSRQPLSKRGD